MTRDGFAAKQATKSLLIILKYQKPFCYFEPDEAIFHRNLLFV